MSQLSIYMNAISPAARRLTTATTALAVVFGIVAFTPAHAQPEQSQQTEQNAPQLSEAQLDQLVAPIALYPDNLLGQILSASTYPLEVTMAARWSGANPRMTGQQLENEMQSQPWNPSVKSLTAVPQVLRMMNEKLEWTQQLGEAYLAQPDDIAAAIQRLRARADASGNLKPSEQIRVRRVAAPRPVVGIGREYIVIESAVPDRVFVPVYDPVVVYGGWAHPHHRPFYWAPQGYVSVGAIGFGTAVVVGTALWTNYNWVARRVFIDPFRFNSFNRTKIAVTGGHKPWQFDLKHRGNQPFNNPVLQANFGNKTGTGHNQPSMKDPVKFHGPNTVPNKTPNTIATTNFTHRNPTINSKTGRLIEEKKLLLQKEQKLHNNNQNARTNVNVTPVVTARTPTTDPKVLRQQENKKLILQKEQQQHKNINQQGHVTATTNFTARTKTPDSREGRKIEEKKHILQTEQKKRP